jgi:predicted RNA polymerase sigma factor
LIEPRRETANIAAQPSRGSASSASRCSRKRRSQAALAALYAEEPQDWPRLALLYGELARVTGSPVVDLNRAEAIAEVGGVEGALELVDGLAYAPRPPTPAHHRTTHGLARSVVAS